MRGGQPSTTQPIAGPWLSPKVVTRNKWPNVLKDMARFEDQTLANTCKHLAERKWGLAGAW
jgi:hypothetical protein